MTTVRRPHPIDLAVDSSALISVLLGEPAADAVHQELAGCAASVISSATLLEAGIVATARLGDAGRKALDDLVRGTDTITMPVDDQLVNGALTAWRRYGRGNHPAKLNFGDCFSYALARHLEVPLLCIGDDFARTDIPVVPERPD